MLNSENSKEKSALEKMSETFTRNLVIAVLVLSIVLIGLASACVYNTNAIKNSVTNFASTAESNATRIINTFKDPLSKCDKCLVDIESLSKRATSSGVGSGMLGGSQPSSFSASARGDASIIDILAEMKTLNDNKTLKFSTNNNDEIKHVLESDKWWKLEDENIYGVYRQYKLDKNEYNRDKMDGHGSYTQLRNDWIIYWSSRENQWVIDISRSGTNYWRKPKWGR